MSEQHEALLKLALPSKGQLSSTSMDFLARAGLRVYRPNERQYAAVIPTIPGIEVVFQRATDIFEKVNDGSVDLGITGYDIIGEYGEDTDDVVIIEKLGFGKCELVLAVPDSWIDVSTLTDLADLAITYKEKGKQLRISTKYGNLTKEWLYKKGITHFTLISSEGALEAAPSMGYADMIADLTETGTTLRENHLKVIEGGVILRSEACLIGSRKSLVKYPEKLRITKHIIELVEAHLRSRKYISVRANIKGKTAEEVSTMLAEAPELSGVVGPSIAKIYAKPNKDGSWYEINILLEHYKLIDATEHLRRIGGSDITIIQASYIFDAKSYIYERLEQDLDISSS